MLWQAVGEVLPSATAVALSPFPVVGVVLVLRSDRARVNGPVFALGWVTGLSLLTALAVGVLSGADDPDSTSSVAADWLRIVLGLALVAAAWRQWRGRPGPDEAPARPGWMAGLEDISAARAGALGAALGGLNPKNIALALGAGSSIAELGLDGGGTVVAGAVFVAISSLTVVGAVVLHAVGGARAERVLDSVQRFMEENNAVIMAVVLLLIGMSVLGQGLGGLDR